MQVEAFSKSLSSLAVDCYVVGVHESGELGDAAKSLDALSGGALRRLLAHGDFAGRVGDVHLVHNLPRVRAARVLLVGQGARSSVTRRTWRKALQHACGALAKTQARTAAISLTRPTGREMDDYTLARSSAEIACLSAYRINDLKSGKKPKPPECQRVLFGPFRASALPAARRGALHGMAIATGATTMRNLANLPGNVCTPSYLAQRAGELAAQYPTLSVQVLDEEAIRKEKMGCLLAVSRGSAEPPRFIVLEHRAGRARSGSLARPVVLVGKGITFDSGGISLKDPPAMDEMKFDMSGAAAVIGALHVAAQLKLPMHVIGLIAACENMPDGRAVKPGDIVTSAAGLTVEILNTDAEGRLVLCDALHYARRFEPAAVLDVATLTGAIVVALGAHHAAVVSNDDALAEELLQSGRDADDRLWRMPLGEEYAEQLKSNFADFANVAGRDGGALTAAAFLGKFTRGLSWAHLDIAGVAYQSGANKGSTGRPLAALADFLIGRSRG
jgi:leucyl aminopeptidase